MRWAIDNGQASETFNTFSAEGALSLWSDDELAIGTALIGAEVLRRAINAGDPTVLLDDVFVSGGFDSRGNANPPWFTADGILVCPGSKTSKSKNSHDCVFVSIDGEWAWTHPQSLGDQMRTITFNGRTIVQSVTLVAPVEGAEVDVVASSARSGPRKKKNVTSYTVVSNTLLNVGKRARTVPGHR